MTRQAMSVLLALTAFGLAGFGLYALQMGRAAPRLGQAAPPASPPARPLARSLTPLQARLMAGAKEQIGTVYDASYYQLSYPNGDPPHGQGACTDVIVRSLRAGGYDLQSLVHQDMTRHWDQYPHRWGLHGPDPNIDHRRVPNLAVFFQRHGQVLTTVVSPKTLSQWQPGDIVCWKLPGGADHCGIVADDRSPQGLPLVIHNLSPCLEQDVLTQWPIAGHYRYPPTRKRLPHNSIALRYNRT